MSQSATSGGIELQPRDFSFLRGLLDSRVMTRNQAAAIYFDGRMEMAKKRLQKLKAAGLIDARKRHGHELSILFLTRAGFNTLRKREFLDPLPVLSWSNLEQRLQVSDLTLRHELEVIDVKASFSSAVQRNAQHHIVEFSTWPMLFQFRASPIGGSEVLVKPDGFIRLHEQINEEVFEHIFYLEVDRSTEPQDTLAHRAQCYLAFYQSGGLAERFGRNRSDYKDFPFRVLMVFKNTERRNNMAERLLTGRPPIFTQVWLSTMSEVIANPFGAIWIQPRDYRDAVAGTAYDVGVTTRRSVYRRQAERETFVEKVIPKHRLLSNSNEA